MVFYTQYGENAPKGSKEAFNKPSMTEPDNTLSIPEIIAKYTRGQGITVNQNPWRVGVAQEEGEPELRDVTPEQVLEMTQQAAQAEPAEPAEPAAAPQEPAPEPAPSPAQAGV